MSKRRPVSFPAFFLEWGERAEWEVPDKHLEACDWLEHRQRLAVLKCFRGFSKSTILGRYIPWKHRKVTGWRFVLMSATDGDAAKLSGDARFVTQQHPWCRGMREKRGLWKVHSYNIAGHTDQRNPSASAYGITSNVTGGRADEAIFDDIEVPKTIASPALRESLRSKADELTHILVPGGSKLYVGTDHCHDSIYKELEEKGADILKIPLYEREVIHKANGREKRFSFKWRIQREQDLFVVVGSKVLSLGDFQVHGVRDYQGGYIELKNPPLKDTVVEIYSDCNWSTRFTAEENKFKREECRTLNAWLSQYQLKAKPLSDSRLDPDRMVPYAGEPEVRPVNGELTMWLNGIRLVGVSTVWDCSLGKVTSDASVLAIIYTDSNGYLYWHRAEQLTGEINAQCKKIVELVKRYKLPNVTVKTAGIGGFVPSILKGHLQRAGLACGVTEQPERQNKNVRILDAFETPLSGMFLYASDYVTSGPAFKQMRAWDPKVLEQPDDFLDAGAGAIAETPVRVGRDPDYGNGAKHEEWRPGMANCEVQVDHA